MIGTPASPPGRPVRRTRGTLTVLAALLLGSAAIRLGTGMGAAVTADLPDPPAGNSSPAGLQTDVTAMMGALREREDRVAAREAALQDRLQALAVTEAHVERRLGDLQAAEAALATTLALADEAAERDLARLTEIYENMKAPEAAAMFAEMEPSFAAGFLARMAPQSAAAVLSTMPPHAAYTISVIVAGRHAGVPTE